MADDDPEHQPVNGDGSSGYTAALDDLDTQSFEQLTQAGDFHTTESEVEIENAPPITEVRPGPSEPPSEKPKSLNFGEPVLKTMNTQARAIQQQKKLAARFGAKTAMAPPEPAPERTARCDSMELDTDAAAAAEKFKKAKAIYDRKVAAGTVTLPQEVEFEMLKTREYWRMQKLVAAQAPDVPDDDDDDDDASGGLFISGVTTPTMASEPVSKRNKGKRKRFADEISDTTDGYSLAPRKSRKTSGKSSRSSERVGADSDEDPDEALARSNRRRKKKTTSKKRDTPNLTNLTSIYGSNVFKDTQKNANLADQPVFDKRRKDEALKQLIASVPAENRKTASADRKYLDEATKEFTGNGVCHPAKDGSGNWTLKGMKSTLKHYQVLGSAFMRKREKEQQEPRGGILADEMGLGKTVMMLANIINGKPNRNSSVRCTLIVASPALCGQWYAEIAKHCQDKKENRQYGIGRYVQHRAGFRLGGDDDKIKQEIAEADICLTTYAEIGKSYPKAVIPPHLVTFSQKDAWWKEYFERNKGIFHQMKFFRIVLDEAQAIKNHKGHTSLACRAVNATHHWAISGTPIMNRLSEFYPYFKFLREPHTGSFRIFKENFCSSDDPEGTGKLAIFLRKIMIRRTHLDTLFGARLLDLPQPKQHVVYLNFNETERAIYDIVKNRFVQRINTIAQKGEGGLANHYNHIWTMLLRLRQLCAHILLIQGTICDLLQREDFEKLNSLAQSTGRGAQGADDGAALLLHLRNVLTANLNNETVEAGGASIGRVISAQQTAPIGAKDYIDQMASADSGGKHGIRFNFEKYIDALAKSDRYGEIMERSTCCACRQVPDQPHVTSCYHIYCLSCIADLQHHAATRGRDCATCHECGTEYTSVEQCKLGPSEPPESTAQSQSTFDPDATPTGKKKKKQQEDDWIGLRGEVLPSAKTIAVKAQILNWIQEDPRVKIIVYTQFMPVVRIFAKICQTELWGHVKYTGSMSLEARNNAIRSFTDNPDTPIMLASLRCGGLGLNLTMASRVILIDPWWNSAVEQQAFCRVFRIGQTKETRMTRFVVENTIDAAMMAMKKRKEIEIDEVMENPRLKERLSVEELMEMFGEVRQDDHGKPFIFAEPDPDEHARYRNHRDDEDDESNMGNEY